MKSRNYSKVEMTDGSTHVVSHAKMSKNNLKSNHIVKQSMHGFEYVVNICNNRAYRTI